MKKLLLILVLSSLSLWGALPGNTTWEVRNAGNDNNGGGFLAGGSGTDWSLQSSPQYALTGLASAGAGAVFLSASASSDMVDNILQVVSGTNFTTGFFRIVSISAGVSITVDRSITTGVGASGVINIGGALKTLSKLNTAMGTSNVQQFAWVKADSTYSISSGVTFNFGNGAGQFTYIQGYTSTRGDNGQPTIQASTGISWMITGANNNSLLDLQFMNFILDCNSQTSTGGYDNQNNSAIVRNVKAINCRTNGFHNSGFAFTCERCAATATFTNQTAFIGGNCIDCYAGDTASTGTTGFSDFSSCIRCIVANFTGRGFKVGNIAGGQVIDSATCYNIQNSCVDYNFGSGTGVQPLTIKNSIMAPKAGQYCFDSTTGPLTIPQYGLYEDYNACYQGSSTGTWNLWTPGAHDVTLSVDPFVNGTGGNLALNNTTGGGASARAVGFPGTLMIGGTGYKDLGTLQHQDSASGGTFVNGYSH